MDEGFVRRTYRSTAFVTVFVVLVLLSYGQVWAIAPLLGGVALGLSLLYALDVLVRRLFTPERAAEAKKKNKPVGTQRALIVFALVKYPLVAFLVWAVVRYWDQQRVMVFTGGFILVQAVIALRGVGRYLTDRKNDKP